ncbi:hypothetical protein GCM10010471_21790 [Leucobacter komagatae]
MPQQHYGQPAPQFSGQPAPSQEFPAPQFPASGPEFPEPQYPGQQAPGQPAPGQAFPAPQFPPPGVQQFPPPGVPHGPAPQGPRRKLSRGALIGIISGAVALVLLIGGSIIGVAASIGARSTPETRAVAAVEEYLTALSESDAEAALEYVDASGQVRKLLTDKVLQRSNELAPISGITVSPETKSGRSEYDVTVSVSFQAGGDTVKRTFDVYSYSEESVRISDGLDLISDTYGYDGLGLQVNGVELEAESYPVFPGSYDFTLANPYFTFDTSKLNANHPSDEPAEAPETDAETTAAALSIQTAKAEKPVKATQNAEAEGTLIKMYTKDDTEMLFTMSPKLTPEGEQTFRDLVRESLNACIADTSLKTACGMDLSGEFQDGIIPTEGTAHRTLPAESDALLNELTPVLDFENPAVVSTYDYLRVDTTIEGELDGQRGKAEILFGGDPGSPSVDFGQDPPVVSWR